jgi:uncharacterized protein YehS (DUF1456 family)
MNVLVNNNLLRKVNFIADLNPRINIIITCILYDECIYCHFIVIGYIYFCIISSLPEINALTRRQDKKVYVTHTNFYVRFEVLTAMKTVCRYFLLSCNAM